jgi:hypothetical protein
MADPSRKTRKLTIAIVWFTLIDIVALLADTTTIYDWVQRSNWFV